VSSFNRARARVMLGVDKISKLDSPAY